MERKTASGIMLAALLLGMLSLTFNIQPAKASGTIYIRADGSVDPPTANITTVDNITYTFTENNYDSIVVERDNIVIDGVHFTVRGIRGGTGIDLSNRDNVTIKNVEVEAFDYGILLQDSSKNSIYGNYIANNWDGILLSSSSNNSVSGNHVTNNTNHGIRLFWSSNNIIFENNITASNWDGISLSSSSNNSISGNNVANSTYGIWLGGSSSNNSLYANSITSNDNGVVLFFSPNNVLNNNSMFGNHDNFGAYGDEPSHFIQDVDTSNTVDGKPIYYWVNRQNMEVPSEAGYVALVDSYNITVKGLEQKNNWQGILLANTTDSLITNNNITSNDFGIVLYYSSHNDFSRNNIENNDLGIGLIFSSGNTISGNNIENNRYSIWLSDSLNNSIFENNVIANEFGIQLYGAFNNSIYHNNFVDNTEQVHSYNSTNVWDDGYPSGGNYWSDYTDVDEKNGPGQDLPGSDGIWDHPYEIDANNNDNYPLVEPWTPLPRTIGELKTEIEEFGFEGEIDNQGIVKSLIAKLNVVQRLVDKGKVDEAKTILEDDFILQVQNLSGTHITPEVADVLIQSAEYILSNL